MVQIRSFSLQSRIVLRCSLLHQLENSGNGIEPNLCFYSISDDIILRHNQRFPSKQQLILQLFLVLKIRLYTLFLLLFFLSFQFLFYWALRPFERHFVPRLHTLSSLGCRPRRSNVSGYYQIRPFHLHVTDQSPL